MNEQQVKDYLFKEFKEWMKGQTISINKDGSTNYYRGDVERFGNRLSMNKVYD